MSKFDTMTDEELKRYFLSHRDEESAFHAYMDRRYAKSTRQTIKSDDPEWSAKVIEQIQTQMNKNQQTQDQQ